MAVLLVEETGLHEEKWFYPSWVPEFTPSFSGVRVSRALALHVVFCRLLLVRLSIKLSVLLQCTDSNSNSSSSNSSYKEQKVKTNIEVGSNINASHRGNSKHNFWHIGASCFEGGGFLIEQKS